MHVYHEETKKGAKGGRERLQAHVNAYTHAHNHTRPRAHTRTHTETQTEVSRMILLVISVHTPNTLLAITMWSLWRARVHLI